MPILAKLAIINLLAQVTESSLSTPEPTVLISGRDTEVAIQALAAMVIRLARMTMIEQVIITGSSREHGARSGLSPEDRRAMSLISKLCLVSGLEDVAAEIHRLLDACSHPFGSWLDIPGIQELGLKDVCLIHGEDSLPTPECEELAEGFSGLTATLEDQLFGRFIDEIRKLSQLIGDRTYTSVREFVVRHPVTTAEKIFGEGLDAKASIKSMMHQEFYQPVPESWDRGAGVPICKHCHNSMTETKGEVVCMTRACARTHAGEIGRRLPARQLLRVSRGVRQYWVEPGLDEIWLYDRLRANGFEAILYPNQDRVDVAIGDVGIDLKAYASPETLGRRFNKSVGGLAHYPVKIVAVPDWLARLTPYYIDRLRTAMQRPDINCMTTGEILGFLSRRAWRTE